MERILFQDSFVCHKNWYVDGSWKFRVYCNCLRFLRSCDRAS